jgi:hypothetical protein
MYQFLNVTDTFLLPSEHSSLAIHCPPSTPIFAVESWIPFIHLSLKVTAFWDGALCSLTEIEQPWARRRCGAPVDRKTIDWTASPSSKRIIYIALKTFPFIKLN